MSFLIPHRIPLGLKLGGMSAIILALMAAVVTVALIALGNIADDGQRTYTDSVKPLTALSDARGTFNLNRALAFKHILTPDSKAQQELASTITANAKAIDAALAPIPPTIGTEAGRVAFAKLQAAIAAYNKLLDHLIALSAGGDQTAALVFGQAKVTPVG